MNPSMDEKLMERGSPSLFTSCTHSEAVLILHFSPEFNTYNVTLFVYHLVNYYLGLYVHTTKQNTSLLNHY